ncbi:MAG: hypothetical protein IPM55_14250 [Acidobacteria bacterium]|nr:hypothetical protein [Acidobacteriota bacterium]
MTVTRSSPRSESAEWVRWYLARDTRMDRKVALKVLPGQFTNDPDRIARFRQEARAASALNHPEHHHNL